MSSYTSTCMDCFKPFEANPGMVYCPRCASARLAKGLAIWVTP